MLFHYLITALRTLRRHWISSLVNLFCLALGIACLVITYAVNVFLAHGDENFEHAERIQVITADFRNRNMNDTRVHDVPQVGPAVARHVQTDFPQLDAVARRTAESRWSVKVDGRESTVAVSFIDPQFHDVFHLPFQAGYDAKALRSSRAAIVTAEQALRLFGSTAVVGRRMSFDKQEVTIAGVIDAIPEPTHMEFELLASMDVREALLNARGIQRPADSDFGAWWRPDTTLYTYAVLPADGSLNQREFSSALREFSARRVPKVDGLTLEFDTAPVAGIGMALIDSQFALYTGTGITAFSLGYFMASLVLLIACLNYANLTAGLASTRQLEIGVRQAMGAHRSQLIIQHLFEAAVIGFASFLLVIVLLLLLTPIVARIGPNLPSLFMLRREFLLFAGVVLIGTTLVAGAYPAFVLTSMLPTRALRGGSRNPSMLMPRLLVGAQFMSVGFLVSLVLVAREQNSEILNTANTLSREPVVTFSKSIRALDMDYEPLRERLLSARHVRAVTASAAPPLSFVSTNEGLGRKPQRGASVTITSRNLVSYDFFSALGIKLTAGREFSRDHADDAASTAATGEPQRIVVDEQLAQRLGWQRPSNAVDQIVYVPAAYGRPAQAFRIIGIVERKPLSVIGLGAASSMYVLDTAKATYVTVRLANDDIGAGLAEIDAIWKQFAPADSGRRTLLADSFQAIYDHLLQATTVMLLGPALFAALISTIGMFGMAIHVTDRRRHEIGVRKTLGARTTQIVMMLLRDMSRPIVIGNLLAWPLAWIAATFYRSMFVDRVPLGIAPFVASLVIALALAWAVVAGRAIAAARLNPASVLRYE